jgi:hypothetical protein
MKAASPSRRSSLASAAAARVSNSLPDWSEPEAKLLSTSRMPRLEAPTDSGAREATR